MLGDARGLQVGGSGREARALDERVLVASAGVDEAADADRGNGGEHEGEGDQGKAERANDRETLHTWMEAAGDVAERDRTRGRCTSTPVSLPGRLGTINSMSLAQVWTRS